MGKLPAFTFYPGDWLRDNVAGCSLAAQGLWLRMMILAHDSDRYGYLTMANGTAMHPETISRRLGVPLDQYVTLLDELTAAGVPSRTPEGIIYSRRMVRDHKTRKLTKLRVRNFRKRNASVTHDVTPLYEDENERCKELAFDVGLDSKESKPKTKAKPLFTDTDIEAIYKVYPRQVGKGEATQAISKALNRLINGEYQGKEVTVGEAIAGLKNRVIMFAQSSAGNRGKYTPHPATWFNQKRYLDDPKEWEDHVNGQANKAEERTANNLAVVQRLTEKYMACAATSDPSGSVRGEPD